jgi:short-subunit dehydrogenase
MGNSMWDKQNILIVGASRGLGRAFVAELDKINPNLNIFLASRKNPNAGQHQFIKFDASKPDDQQSLLKFIDEVKPQRIYYFSGGGPYGEFKNFEWKDHEWALQVNFLAPAKILHHALGQPGEIMQIGFVGSLIAENNAHPMGASYGAAKSALLSLISSVVAEKSSKIDIRLFSPDYIDTDLLPKNAFPRRMNLPILPTEVAAQKMLAWLVEPGATWHYQLKA